jgi:hypothetical protein
MVRQLGSVADGLEKGREVRSNDGGVECKRGHWAVLKRSK